MPEESVAVLGADIDVIDLREVTVPGDLVVVPDAEPLPLRRQRWKRVVETLLTVLLVLLLAPLLLWIAAAVLLTSGRPFWYSQSRVGRGGKHFECYKFRTMVRDADAVLVDLLAEDEALRNEFANGFKLKNDPRVTKLGRILRKTSLDELPQLLNVLRGDMALVGPRPMVDSEIPLYGPHFDTVTSVRPGLTGLWQVSGRNHVSYTQRVEMDVIYVSRHSMLTDTVILLKTLKQVVLPFRNGAY